MSLLRKLILCGFLALVGISHARKAIQVEITQGGNTETVGFTSMEDAINSWDELQATYGDTFNDNDNFTGTLDVLGFDVTIDFVAASGPNLASLTYTFTDPDGVVHTETFEAATKDEAVDLFEDFFESEVGESEISALLTSLQTGSQLNLVSGMISMMGEGVFFNAYSALGKSFTGAEVARADLETGGWSISGETGDFKSGEFTGEASTVAVTFDNRLSRHFHISSRIPFRYTDVGGSEIYGVGLELNLGIRPFATDSTSLIDWEITPVAGNVLTASEDLAIAADIYNYGVRNRIQANLGFFSLSYGYYYGMYESYDIETDDYTVDLGVDMSTESHGVKAAFRLGNHIVIDGFFMTTDSDDSLRFKEVETIGGSLSLRVSLCVLQVGYAIDESADSPQSYEYERYFGRLMMRF